MDLIGNALNGHFLGTLVRRADAPSLKSIRLAVAYVTKMDDIFELAGKRSVPLTLYALADGDFPSPSILRKFVESNRPSWQLHLTRDFYHPKIMWFVGIGAYLGSANLTDGGAVRNLECGVWLDETELARAGWDAQLEAMLSVIAARSTAATREHLRAFEGLKAEAGSFEAQRRKFRAAVDRALANIAGVEPPNDPTAMRGGGAARKNFVQEWQNGLTILRKITEMFSTYPLPRWVRTDVPLSLVQDQATEAWYHENIRSTGESYDQIQKLHSANRADPDSATRAVFADWVKHADEERYGAWVNDHPLEVNRLLQPDELKRLDRSRLTRILSFTHASRTHARQIRNEDLGLPRGSETSMEERCDLYAKMLLASTSEGGKKVGEILDFVLWGDAAVADPAERIWAAISTSDWSIPHLGLNSLGEMIGYARPTAYPPRNGRVSKTLHALGYEGIVW
ncbi:MAG TPA: phospholipase D family protein [Fimbriimonadaceae bacterium]|nr:phospholipase D family protein [Fimbriimonadaceae bacterium]